MKTQLLTAILLMLVTSTQVLAARPSINSLNTRVNQLEAENNAQQAQIDALGAAIGQSCPDSTYVVGFDDAGNLICFPPVSDNIACNCWRDVTSLDAVISSMSGTIRCTEFAPIAAGGYRTSIQSVPDFETYAVMNWSPDQTIFPTRCLVGREGTPLVDYDIDTTEEWELCRAMLISKMTNEVCDEYE